MMCPVSYRRSRTYVSNPKTLGGGREEERVSAIPCSGRSSGIQLSMHRAILSVCMSARQYVHRTLVLC